MSLPCRVDVQQRFVAMCMMNSPLHPCKAYAKVLSEEACSQSCARLAVEMPHTILQQFAEQDAPHAKNY